MIEIFKTNVTHHFDAIRLKELLVKEFPKASFHFDVSHNDKLLRVEGKNVPTSRVAHIIKQEGYYCELTEMKN